MCDPLREVDLGIGCIPKGDPLAFANTFYGIGLSLIGAVAILFFIYGSYTILICRGDPQMLNKGKSYIFYAIAGLLLAIFGYVFIEIIAVDILHIPGFAK